MIILFHLLTFYYGFLHTFRLSVAVLIVSNAMPMLVDAGALHVEVFDNSVMGDTPYCTHNLPNGFNFSVATSCPHPPSGKVGTATTLRVTGTLTPSHDLDLVLEFGEYPIVSMGGDIHALMGDKKIAGIYG